MSRRVLVMVVAAVLAAAACTTATDTSDPSTTTLGTTTTVAATSTSSTTTVPSTTTTSTIPDFTGFPVTINAPNGPVTIEAQPERIVSLSPTSTEVLFAVGAGSQVVAVDNQSTYPADAPVTDLTGFEPNLEAIAGYDADLVILMYDPGEAIAGLEAIGIPVIMHPAAVTLDDVYGQIEQVGKATGHNAEAERLISSMVEGITAASASVDGDGLTYYHELSPDYYTVTSSTFVGSLYALFGLENIADGADPDGFGYPQLSPEHILNEDPAMIFLADTKCCDQDASTVAARPGWDVLGAVASENIIELDDDVASRWGPRVVDFVESIAQAVGGYREA